MDTSNKNILGVKKDSIASQIIQVIILSVGLIAISRIEIQIFLIPFTFQTGYVVLTSLICSKKQVMSYLTLYLILALLGLPVLAGGGVISTNILSFGFVLGFVPMGYIVSTYFDRDKFSYINIIKISVAATLVLYSFGVSWYILLLGDYTFGMFEYFLIFDFIKIITIIIIYKYLDK